MSTREAADLPFLHDIVYNSGDYLMELSRRRSLTAAVASRLMSLLTGQEECEPRSVTDPVYGRPVDMQLRQIEQSVTTTVVGVKPSTGYSAHSGRFGVVVIPRTGTGPRMVGELEVVRLGDIPAKLKTVAVSDGVQVDTRSADMDLPYQHNVLLGMVAEYLDVDQPA